MHQIPIIPVEAFEGFAGIFKKTDDAQGGIASFLTAAQDVVVKIMGKIPVESVRRQIDPPSSS